MDCAVYDTYVEKKDGKVMHFDVIVEKDTPHDRAIEYGKSLFGKCRPRRPKHDPGRMPILSYSKDLQMQLRKRYPPMDFIYKKWKAVLN